MAVRRNGSTVFACLVVALSSAATLSAQAAADPWKRVPPLTADCYRDDGFDDKVVKLKESVEADLARQEATNGALKQQMEKLPPMEMQRRRGRSER